MSMTTSGGGNGLIPTNLTDAMRLAEMMAKGKMVPEHLRNPSDMLMVIEQACRWSMSPFAVAQCTAIVRGRISYEGKLVAAAVQSSGVLSGRMNYVFSGEGAARAVTASATIKGETTPREVVVTLASAKTDNEHWKKSPDQMLTYHAARVWARRHTPEVMLGVYSPEEFDQPKDNFTGTTIEIRPDPEQVMQPTEPPTKTRTWGTFLDELAPELAAVQTYDEIVAIEARPLVKKARATLQNGAMERLEHMFQEAMDRVLAAGDPPLMDGESETPEVEEV